jgi:DNA helicase-2/ATP-dependent DNA helicase PcrA
VGTFTGFIEELRSEALHNTVSELVRTVVIDSGYKDALEAEDTDESRERMQNIDELISKAVQYETNADQPTLSGFLEEVALIADIDTVDDGDDRVLLMTLHSAKGLEFPVVYMAGMEEGLFPSSMSLNAEDSDEQIEEERRLCYVGITRAKELLTLTCAYERMTRGQIEPHSVSRFVREIARDKLDQGRKAPAKSTIDNLRGGFGKDMRDAIQTKAFAPKPSSKMFTNPYTSSNSNSRSDVPTKTGPRIYDGTASKQTETSDGMLGYEVGDSVIHKKFGVGTVKAIREGGRDFEVTVDFPSWGVKKMFAAFAKLEKVEE